MDGARVTGCVPGVWTDCGTATGEPPVEHVGLWSCWAPKPHNMRRLPLVLYGEHDCGRTWERAESKFGIDSKTRLTRRIRQRL